MKSSSSVQSPVRRAGDGGGVVKNDEVEENMRDCVCAMPHILSVSPQASSSAHVPQPSTSLSSSTMISSMDIIFPKKLFVMLHEAERDSFADVVSWGREGAGNFKVHKKRDFEQFILPKYFKMTKYKSFTRQLHNYNFMWIRIGPDKGGCK
jgi:hypothetical protein